ncbi:MAG TPA: hypothetical protein PKY77_05675 [Phycisphaerae bacterium]|nr:hypothetical protein [Phycisphaerae bacterium]HRY69067.1 hypothetical protein [Phycisphaerae bacterium]HSA25958.1 hypothetical protein [Phycisphaerae bacterium]
MHEEIVKIVVPSHLRAERVATIHAVPNVILCVSEAQAPAYREHNPGVEIVTHPDDLAGLSPKRQWIIQKFGAVMQLDDDLEYMQRVYLEDSHTGRVHRLSRIAPETCWDIIQATAATARELGVHLFGFAGTAQPHYYRPQKPFNLTGFVCAAWTGVLPGFKFWYDRRAELCDDYWITGLNAYFHRMCFIDNRYSFHTGRVGHNLGGLGGSRTVEKEKSAYEFLKRTFGSAVGRKTEPPGRRKTLGHEWERCWMSPF